MPYRSDPTTAVDLAVTAVVLMSIVFRALVQHRTVRDRGPFRG